MELNEFRSFSDALVANLADDPRVLGIVALGSIARTTCPTSGGPPSFPPNPLASKEKFESATPPDMRSTSSASADPL